MESRNIFQEGGGWQEGEVAHSPSPPLSADGRRGGGAPGGAMRVNRDNRAGQVGASGAFEVLEAALVRAAVRRVQEVLPLPTVVNALLKTAQDPYASLSRLADTVLRDQALTARVLRLVNSPFYGLAQPVGTVSQAVMLLGLDKIKHLALAVSLAEGLFRHSGLSFGRKALWHHSQACGVATSLAAQAAGYPLPEEALVIGLLHDIAKVFWAEVFPERWQAALTAIREEGQEPLAAEKAYLTVPHAQVGAWMLETWGLPPLFVQAVQAHHHPDGPAAEAPAPTLSRALYLGNLMAHLLNLGDGGHSRLPPAPAELLRALCLTPEGVVDLLRKLPGALARFLGEMELDPPDMEGLKNLTGLLQGRPVLWLQDGGDPEPAGWALKALAPHTAAIPWEALPRSQPSPGGPAPLLFWSGADPAGVLKAVQENQALYPTATLALFITLPGQGVRLPPPPPLRMQVFGPDWRLEDFARVLFAGKRV
ncbi:MAG: HDOD domain-containing protein [Deltaproteobacteria bacterium]|nr:HDOD domain-containing protein [Deltaproteobacteria bacterium]MBM4285773.1 HDOD domain-containing protein [Deltaproteobacteria bacterium]